MTDHNDRKASTTNTRENRKRARYVEACAAAFARATEGDPEDILQFIVAYNKEAARCRTVHAGAATTACTRCDN